MRKYRYGVLYVTIDLGDENGFLCGRILGDLGTDVIEVKKTGRIVGGNSGKYHL